MLFRLADRASMVYSMLIFNVEQMLTDKTLQVVDTYQDHISCSNLHTFAHSPREEL